MLLVSLNFSISHGSRPRAVILTFASKMEIQIAVATSGGTPRTHGYFLASLQHP